MPGYAIQQQNEQLISLLSARFRLLDNPAHAMADSLSMLKMFPGIAGLWSTAVTDSAGRLIDVSGNGLHMTAVNTPQFGQASNNLSTFIRYSAASSQYHSLASAIGSTTDINGNETYIRSEARGLTVIWVGLFTNTPASAFYLTAKSIGGANSWLLAKTATNTIQFSVFSGAAQFSVTSLVTVSALQQYIITARFLPSTGLYLRVNNDETSNTTAIPATIDSTATAFTIGARATPEAYFDGTFSFEMLAAAYADDTRESIWYQMTSPLFGISM